MDDSASSTHIELTNYPKGGISQAKYKLRILDEADQAADTVVYSHFTAEGLYFLPLNGLALGAPLRGSWEHCSRASVARKKAPANPFYRL